MARLTLYETRRTIRANWPAYFGLYGALIAAMMLLGLGLASGWYALVPFALAIFIVFAYLLVALLWTTHHAYDGPGRRVMEVLLDYSQVQPEDRVACIDLGLRLPAIHIAQRLTSGQVVVVDVYNPQSTTGGSLRRARSQAPRPVSDPRLNWIDGNINLLPLADRSVKAVFMNHILSEYWLPEDRQRLLTEVWRVLVPEGRLLLAERVRGQTNPVLTGLITSSQPPPAHWRSLLMKSDFTIQREETLRGLVYCVRADKPSPAAAKQLPLLLEFL